MKVNKDIISEELLEQIAPIIGYDTGELKEQMYSFLKHDIENGVEVSEMISEGINTIASARALTDDIATLEVDLEGDE